MTEYWKEDSKLFSYLQFPRGLLDEDINATTMLIYMVLLDRVRLSAMNGEYKDEQGSFYCRYTIEELAETLHRGVSSIKDSLRVLEQKGLIRRVHETGQRATKIFVLARSEYLYPEAEEKNNATKIQPENAPIYGRKTDQYVAGKPAANKNNRVRTKEKEAISSPDSYYTKGDIYGFQF